MFFFLNKVLRNKEREAELELEKYEMLKMVEHNKQQEKSEKENLIARNKQYGNDLLMQKEFLEIEKRMVYEFYFFLD